MNLFNIQNSKVNLSSVIKNLRDKTKINFIFFSENTKNYYKKLINLEEFEDINIITTVFLNQNDVIKFIESYYSKNYNKNIENIDNENKNEYENDAIVFICSYSNMILFNLYKTNLIKENNISKYFKTIIINRKTTIYKLVTNEEENTILSKQVNISFNFVNNITKVFDKQEQNIKNSKVLAHLDFNNNTVIENNKIKINLKLIINNFQHNDDITKIRLFNLIFYILYDKFRVFLENDSIIRDSLCFKIIENLKIRKNKDYNNVNIYNLDNIKYNIKDKVIIYYKDDFLIFEKKNNNNQ